jgi:hypothetical protein
MDYVQKAIELRKSKDFVVDGAGLTCRFMKLNDKVGVKWYTEKAIRNKTMRLQQLAYAIGIGPEVIGEPFECEVNDYTYYGYLTEIVDIHYYLMYEHINGAWDIKSVRWYLFAAKKAFARFGIEMRDIHTQNFGWNEKGFAIIDFDDFTAKSQDISGFVESLFSVY